MTTETKTLEMKIDNSHTLAAKVEAGKLHLNVANDDRLIFSLSSMPTEDAEKLRDFLNYALPKKDIEQ